MNISAGSTLDLPLATSIRDINLNISGGLTLPLVSEIVRTSIKSVRRRHPARTVVADLGGDVCDPQWIQRFRCTRTGQRHGHGYRIPRHQRGGQQRIPCTATRLAGECESQRFGLRCAGIARPDLIQLPPLLRLCLTSLTYLVPTFCGGFGAYTGSQIDLSALELGGTRDLTPAREWRGLGGRLEFAVGNRSGTGLRTLDGGGTILAPPTPLRWRAILRYWLPFQGRRRWMVRRSRSVANFS